MSAAWKQDYPNVRHYNIFQVQPKPCSMGPKGDWLREAQRTLPRLFSNMDVMSTIGLDSALGYQGCHYTAAGYTQIAVAIAPMVKRDNYALVPASPITAPDLKRVYFTTVTKNEIALEFGQAMVWNAAAAANIYLDQLAGQVTAGSVSGNIITLQLGSASTAQTITYLKDQIWNGSASSLLRGANGIAALTFCEVQIPATIGNIPTVTTSAASAITDTTATAGGTVTAVGGSAVSARGVCWGTSANPLSTGNHTTDGSGAGAFTSAMTGLTANALYHVRAYATNGAGTAYGADLTVTTTPASAVVAPEQKSYTCGKGVFAAMLTLMAFLAVARLRFSALSR